MSELPKERLATDAVPVSTDYADAFFKLPLQATLNMLEAYKPQGNNREEQQVRLAMEAVRSALLYSGQQSRGLGVDLSDVAPETMQAASEQLWRNVPPKITSRFRPTSDNVIPLARRKPA